QKQQLLSRGRNKFNADSTKGIQFLIECKVLNDDAESVAEFLLKGEGLHKSAIGEYLGEKNEFNLKVLRAFTFMHQFSDILLVQALRQYLWSFMLPGESQKIDRIMECFSEKYCSDNPHVFTNSEVCFVLSFALIMLNTSLHNANVKDKLSSEKFSKMVRGIASMHELPADLIETLYKSIKREPLKLPSQSDCQDLMYTFFNPIKEGWLYKKRGTWKRRWFLLNNGCLYYFIQTTDLQPRSIIPLENLKVDVCNDSKRQNCFKI
ncbi:hypothetical protein HELRODRAFT_132380, partial [Helobdella robusta]|uniref:SEC7 domain-containing protein n=1 Tax=Helobdella robusta TaxID=6412 RepID=T1EHY3_HELRO